MPYKKIRRNPEVAKALRAARRGAYIRIVAPDGSGPRQKRLAKKIEKAINKTMLADILKLNPLFREV